MGKSNASEAGVVFMLDSPTVIRRKIARAVTDNRMEVRYDPERQPGVANLLDILAACVDDTPTALARLFSSYGELKAAVADTVVSTLAPVRERYAELAADPAGVRAVLRDGAERARAYGAGTVRRAKEAIGLAC